MTFLRYANLQSKNPTICLDMFPIASHRISTLAMLFHLTAIYWILRCIALLSTDFRSQLPYLTMLAKWKTKFLDSPCDSDSQQNLKGVHPWPTLHPVTKFHGIQCGRFCTILLKVGQANHTKNITSLAKLTI